MVQKLLQCHLLSIISDPLHPEPVPAAPHLLAILNTESHKGRVTAGASLLRLPSPQVPRPAQSASAPGRAEDLTEAIPLSILAPAYCPVWLIPLNTAMEFPNCTQEYLGHGSAEPGMRAGVNGTAPPL